MTKEMPAHPWNEVHFIPREKSDDDPPWYKRGLRAWMKRKYRRRCRQRGKKEGRDML